MNKKIMIIIIFSITLIIGIILLVSKLNKNKIKLEENNEIEKEESEISFEDDSGNEYTSIYSESNLVYEIYDEKGNLVAISPTESGVKEYMENPELMFSINNE